MTSVAHGNFEILQRLMYISYRRNLNQDENSEMENNPVIFKLKAVIQISGIYYS